MAAHVNVNISFEADSPEDAEDTIAGWQLSPGCVVVATVNAVVTAGTVDDTGTILAAPTPEDDEPTVEEHIDGTP
jgi:hypothetical protein